MIPFKFIDNPKSNYYIVDRTNSDGKSIRSMHHKPLYTCEESQAMKDYEDGIALWLYNLMQR